MPATQQQERILFEGVITQGDNAFVKITMAAMSDSPYTMNVGVSIGDSMTTIATNAAEYLNYDPGLHAVALAYNIGPTLYLMARTPAANDPTMNIEVGNVDSLGLTAKANSEHYVLGDDGTSIINGYATLAEYKAEFTVLGTDAARDAVINRIIQNVSRKIDDHCFRVFYGAAPATARYYSTNNPYRVFIDDCTSISAIGIDLDGSFTYATPMTTSDYYALPANKLPITYLERHPLGNYNFPTMRNGVKVTAVWGYNLTSAGAPGPVHEACLLQAYRIYERRKAPFGVTSVSELAPMTVIKLDVDVQDMLEPYVKGWGG